MHHAKGDLMALRAGFLVISILLGLTVGYVTGDGEDALCRSRRRLRGPCSAERWCP